jgi:hypothetical protein
MVNLADFKLSSAKRAEITAGLTAQQTKMVTHWMDLHEVLNRGDFASMDPFFHKDMTYSNPNRPDLGTYAVWKTSPQGLYKTFPPSVYRTLKAWGKGEDEICVLCHHYGKQTGGPYMGRRSTCTGSPGSSSRTTRSCTFTRFRMCSRCSSISVSSNTNSRWILTSRAA